MPLYYRVYNPKTIKKQNKNVRYFRKIERKSYRTCTKIIGLKIL